MGFFFLKKWPMPGPENLIFPEERIQRMMKTFVKDMEANVKGALKGLNK